MTMPFDVKDTNESPVETGTTRFLPPDGHRYRRMGGSDKPLGAPQVADTNSARASAVRVMWPLNVGEPLPEYHLDQRIGSADYHHPIQRPGTGDYVFVHTLPFPTFCPRLANDFSETQEKLLGLQGGPTNWHLLTISFIRSLIDRRCSSSYALRHTTIEPAHSTFATGDLGDIISMGDCSGLAFWHDSTGSITHNMRTVVIDSTGGCKSL